MVEFVFEPHLHLVEEQVRVVVNESFEALADGLRHLSLPRGVALVPAARRYGHLTPPLKVPPPPLQGAVRDMYWCTLFCAHLALVSIVTSAKHELHHHCLVPFAPELLGAADAVWVVERDVAAVGGAQGAVSSALAAVAHSLERCRPEVSSQNVVCIHTTIKSLI